MYNPCDRVFQRPPRAPGLKDPGDVTLEVRPVEGMQPPVPEPAVPSRRVAGDARLALPNALAEAAGALKPEPAEVPAPDPELPAVAQRVLDLISRNSPALDSVLSALAGPVRAPEPGFTAMGGRLGRVASSDALRPRRPALPPLAEAPLAPIEDLAPPIEPAPVEAERLEELPAPPVPACLQQVYRQVITIPWTAPEGERLRQEAPQGVSVVRVQRALGQIEQLEAFVGCELRMVSDRSLKGVTNREGFRRLACAGTAEQAGPVGAYLVALHDAYRAYKADYYGLRRARRALLDRRDPAALDPLASDEELLDYLWRKYGEALGGRLWRLMRTAARRPDVLPPLSEDRPWHSGGSEPSLELVRPGVYVALRSDEGDFELQKEQGNPWSAQGIFNLAVAVRLGRDVVAYDVRSGVLKLNGRVVPWSPGGYELPDGARLELGDEHLHIVSRRGDTVVARISGRTLVLSGTVSGDRPVSSVAGALGAFQEDRTNTWVTRDGRRVEAIEALLESWRPHRHEALL